MPDWLYPSFEWALEAVGIAIAGGVGALVLQNIVAHWSRPILQFSISSEEPHIRRVQHNSGAGHADWVRLAVTNVGKTEAKSVRAFLSDFSRVGDQRPIFQGDALLLWASSGGDGGHNVPLTIAPKFTRFFDVTCALGKDELNIPSEHYIHLRGYPPGTYRFKVWVSGANIKPTSTIVEVIFAGIANPIFVSLI